MCLSVLGDARLYVVLLKFDEDLADRARGEGCGVEGCAGVLHSARYSRKPRGAAVLPEGYDQRHSFCCAEEGCRRRTTPPSLRFLGRRVYLGAVVTLVTAMRHGVTGRRAGELRRAIGASRETLSRWRRWWRDIFPASAFWTSARALLSPPVAIDALPSSLLERFGAENDIERLMQVLDFIKPLTTGSAAPSGAI